MPSAKLTTGTAFIFAESGVWAPGTSGWSATVDSGITLAGLASDGYRQTAKGADLTVNRDISYNVELSAAMATGPTGGTLDLYVAFSENATAGTGNHADLTGTDTVYAAGADGVKQMLFVGSLVMQAISTVQRGEIGKIQPTGRYPLWVVHNNTNQSMEAVGANCAIKLTAIVHEIQG